MLECLGSRKISSVKRCLSEGVFYAFNQASSSYLASAEFLFDMADTQLLDSIPLEENSSCQCLRRHLIVAI